MTIREHDSEVFDRSIESTSRILELVVIRMSNLTS